MLVGVRKTRSFNILDPLNGRNKCLAYKAYDLRSSKPQFGELGKIGIDKPLK